MLRANFHSVAVCNSAVMEFWPLEQRIKLFLRFIWDKMGIKAFPYLSCPYGTIKLHFSQLEADATRKLIEFFKTCKCGMLCVNFHSVTVYNSAVMEFCPLPFEQRIKLFVTLPMPRGGRIEPTPLMSFLSNFC